MAKMKMPPMMAGKGGAPSANPFAKKASAPAAKPAKGANPFAKAPKGANPFAKKPGK